MHRYPWILAAAALFLALSAGMAAAQIRIEGNAVIQFQGGGVQVRGDNVQIVPDERTGSLIILTSGGPVMSAAEAYASATPDPKADLATTTLGDRFVGTVVAMESGGPLCLTGPQFKSDVRLSAGAVESIVLRGADTETGPDEVSLTNDDQVKGTVSAITTDNVIVKTAAAGPLKISRKIVRSISFGSPESILIESAFSTGRTEPWISSSPPWSVKDGVLTLPRRTDDAPPLYVRLDQKEAVTLVAKVQSTSPERMEVVLALFAGGADDGSDLGRYGQNSVMAIFQNNSVSLSYSNDVPGADTSIGRRNFGRLIQGGVMRLAYDPAAGKAHAWLDATDLGEYDVGPEKPATGKFVIFSAYFPLKVEYLKVYRGVVPPVDPKGAPAAAPEAATAAKTVVHFTNSDHLSANNVTLADGEFTVATPLAEIRCPAQSVSRIVFGKNGLEEPRRQKEDVQVTASFGRLTFQFQGLTADFLLGRSESLGEFKLRRGAVREIRFNPHR
jgi:hypothetical protein